jgi:hypothetical protein
MTIPDWLVRRSEISPGAKIVYAFLADNTCQPDYPEYDIASGVKTSQIAEAIGALERSVRNWITELETEKLIRARTVGWGRPNFRSPSIRRKPFAVVPPLFAPVTSCPD